MNEVRIYLRHTCSRYKSTYIQKPPAELFSCRGCFFILIFNEPKVVQMMKRFVPDSKSKEK